MSPLGNIYCAMWARGLIKRKWIWQAAGPGGKLLCLPAPLKKKGGEDTRAAGLGSEQVGLGPGTVPPRCGCSGFPARGEGCSSCPLGLCHRAAPVTYLGGGLL